MSTKIIKINRGDSFKYIINVEKKSGAEKYSLDVDEAVYFALMYPNQPFEEAIWIKGYTHADLDQNTGKIIVSIEHNDTRFLAPGIYYYTVKLQRGENLEVINSIEGPKESKTLVERTKFIINE